MKKYNLSYLFVGLSLTVLLVAFGLFQEQQTMASKLIRLHVVANSDSETDQWVKLQVRDAVLSVTQPLLFDAQDNPQAVLAENLEAIQTAANETLSNLGCEKLATVTLEKELFPTREYDTFTLPAGTYESLRVTIGGGQGHNWWCVVYPALCFSASLGDFNEAAQTAGLTQGEIALITQENPTYELKFQTLEWLQKLLHPIS